jgi:ABC-type polysaccharide/polyol phosphate transport system ATPase subunit
LAVGDERFRQRCLERLTAFQQNRGTVICVSHDLNSVKRVCTRDVWMARGKVRLSGGVHGIVGTYWVATKDELKSQWSTHA